MKYVFSFVALCSLLAGSALPAAAAEFGITTSAVMDKTCLVKGSGSTVYAVMPDGTRRFFPNVHTWASWYVQDVSCIQNVTDEELSQMRLSGMITIMPGSSLVKMPSDPKVYAIEAPNVLRWITSEDTAKALYGEAWQKKVADVDESLFATYTFGAPIVEAANYDLTKALSTPRPWEVTVDSMPHLSIKSRTASNLVELGLTVPKNATVPTSIVDISVKEEDRTALTLCDVDCSVTIQLNQAGVFQAMTWMDGMFHVSEKISLDPLEGMTTDTQQTLQAP